MPGKQRAIEDAGKMKRQEPNNLKKRYLSGIPTKPDKVLYDYRMIEAYSKEHKQGKTHQILGIISGAYHRELAEAVRAERDAQLEEEKKAAEAQKKRDAYKEKTEDVPAMTLRDLKARVDTKMSAKMAEAIENEQEWNHDIASETLTWLLEEERVKVWSDGTGLELDYMALLGELLDEYCPRPDYEMLDRLQAEEDKLKDNPKGKPKKPKGNPKEKRPKAKAQPKG